MSRHIATPLTTVVVATILLTGVAAGRSASWGQQPPKNLTPPAISGTVKVGRSLTATTGSWQRVSSYAFQWLRCDSASASCGPIAGASASTYTVSSGDAGHTLRVLVTASNKNGTAAAVSAATQVVPSPTASSPAPDTAITNVTCGTSVSAFPNAVCLDSNNDGGNSTTVTFTISNADGAQCQMDDGSYAGTWAPCTSGTIQFWVPVGGPHTLYVRAKRSSDGAVDSSPAAASLTVCPSSGCSSPAAPPPSPPSATSAPTISGTPQQGQTLSASTGSWSGTTPISYAYQWQRCNSSGGSCTPVAGATASSYLLVSADVGSTMRVSVTGINSAGSATASSAATAVVGALPSAPAPSATPYANNGFEGNIQTDVTTSPFYIARSDGGGFSSAYWQAVTGFSGQGLRLAVDSNLAYGSGNLGPLSFVGVDQGTAHTLPGESTWYRVRFKIPSSGFVGGYGEFQWLWEWHEQSPCDGNSTGFGLIDYHDGNPATGIGHMQLWFRPAGGNGNSPYYERWVLPYPSNVIQLDHWYDIVVNVVWDTKASNAGGRGAISVWVDGAVAPLRL